MNFIRTVQFNIKKAIKITGRGNETSSEATVIIQVKGDDGLHRLAALQVMRPGQILAVF